MLIPSIVRSVLVNLLGRSTIVILNLIFIPIFFRLLGPSNFAIIGLYISALALLQVLDFGLGTGLCKHVAQVKHQLSLGRYPSTSDLQIIYTSEIVYLGIGLTVAIALLFFGPSLNFVSTFALASNDLFVVFFLFGFSLLSQWMINFYGNGFIGLDRQGGLNCTRVVIASATSLMSLAFVVEFGGTPVSYFYGQAVGLGVGALVSRGMFCIALPWLKSIKDFPKYRLKALLPTLHFNLAMGALGVVSIFASQADKLFLISHATTDQYGFYTIGMQVSNSVGTLASCVYATIFPLFAVSVAYDRCSLPKVRSFLIGTVLMCIVLVPNSLALIIMGTDILNVWLGVSLPETGVLGIRLLIGGTMINSLMLVLVVVQIVNSHMRFSILKNVGILVISWPALGFLYDLYGVAGVAGFWLAQNVVFFLFEPFYICKRFVGFSTLRWYLFPVLIPFCIAAVGGWFIYSRFISFLDVHAYIKFLFLDFLLFLFMIFPTWLLLPQTGFNIKSLIYTTGK